MASKRKHKHNDPTPSVRAFSYNHADLSDSEEPDQIMQTNIIMRATHDSRGRNTTQTIHTPFIEAEEPPVLDAIYAALTDDNESTTYGNEEFHAPLADEDTSPPIVEHQVPEDDTTVGLLNNFYSYPSADCFRS